MNIDQQKFTTNDVLDVLTALELDVPGVNKAKLAQERQRTHSRLRAWHQRGILAGRGHCDGPGSERDYSFDDVLFLAAMIYTSRRVADLRNAEQIARHLHTFLKEGAGFAGVYLIITEAGWARLQLITPTMTANSIGLSYGGRTPTVLLPAQLFANIYGAIEAALAKR